MLENRVALITGSASGIGLATARKFLTDPKYSALYLADINPAIRTSFSPSEYPQVIPIEIDLRRQNLVGQMMARIGSDEGRLDVVINAAGIIVAENPVPGFFDDNIGVREHMNLRATNTLVPAHIMLHALEMMREGGGGAIINVTSAKDYFPDIYRLGYLISKKNLSDVTLNAALYGVRHNIRVVEVKPGSTKTNIDQGDWVKGNDSASSSSVQGLNDWWRKIFGNDPDNVAEVIYQIAEGNINGFKVHVGRDAKLGYFLDKFVPCWGEGFLIGSYLAYKLAEQVHFFESNKVSVGVERIQDASWYQEALAHIELPPTDLENVYDRASQTHHAEIDTVPSMLEYWMYKLVRRIERLFWGPQ